MIQSFGNYTPVIGDHTYVSPNATIIGNVTIGEYCYVGPNAVIRGDFGKITIGNHVAIEDCVVIHTSECCTIGNNVILGHSSIIHCNSIGDNVLVGMGAILSIASIIASECLICEGAVIKNRQVTDSYTMLAGAPATMIKNLDEKYVEKISKSVNEYGKLAQMYLNEMGC